MKSNFYFVLTFFISVACQSCYSTIDFIEIPSEKLINENKSIHISYIVTNFKDSQKVESIIDKKACNLIYFYKEFDVVSLTFYRKSRFTNINRLEKNSDNLVDSMQNDYLWTYHFKNGKFRFKMNDSLTSFKIRNKENICTTQQ